MAVTENALTRVDSSLLDQKIVISIVPESSNFGLRINYSDGTNKLLDIRSVLTQLDADTLNGVLSNLSSWNNSLAMNSTAPYKAGDIVVDSGKMYVVILGGVLKQIYPAVFP